MPDVLGCGVVVVLVVVTVVVVVGAVVVGGIVEGTRVGCCADVVLTVFGIVDGFNVDDAVVTTDVEGVSEGGGGVPCACRKYN